MARTIAKDHDDKRRLILKRAAHVFATEGFDRASVARVAKACEISKANIYHYYASKDDILFDILNSYLSGLRDRICDMDLSELSAEDAFRRTLRDVLLSYQGADDEHRLQINGINQLQPNLQKQLRMYQSELVHFMSDRIAQVGPDTLRSDAQKLHEITMSVFGMLNWHYMWNTNADEAARENYAGVIADLTLDGIRKG